MGMLVTGIIDCLDLGVRCGFASGPAGQVPFSCTVVLKKRGESRLVCLSNFVAFLQDRWSQVRPALVVKEAALPLDGYKRTGNSQDRVKMDYAMHGIVEAMTARFGIRLEEVHQATVRLHFLGKGRPKQREEIKHATVARCHLLGLMPKDKYDDDRADAISIHDFASATYGQRSASMKELHFFGEQP